MFKKSLSFALLFTFVATFSHISFAAEVLYIPSNFMADFIRAEIEDMFKEGEEEEEEEEESSEDNNSEVSGQEYESEEEEFSENHEVIGQKYDEESDEKPNLNHYNYNSDGTPFKTITVDQNDAFSEEEEEESSESKSSDQETVMALFWKDVENNSIF